MADLNQQKNSGYRSFAVSAYIHLDAMDPELGLVGALAVHLAQEALEARLEARLQVRLEVLGVRLEVLEVRSYPQANSSHQQVPAAW